jgi:hypothetical protein
MQATAAPLVAVHPVHGPDHLQLLHVVLSTRLDGRGTPIGALRRIAPCTLGWPRVAAERIVGRIGALLNRPMVPVTAVLAIAPERR